MSGFSSGALMTTLMQVSFSNEIKGIGIEAGAPFMAIPTPYKDGDTNRKHDMNFLISLL